MVEIISRNSVPIRRISLIAPDDFYLFEGGDRPPLGIASIGAYLRQRGHEVQLLDLNHIKDYVKEVSNFNPDFVGLSFTTPLYYIAHDVARELRKVVPQSKFVAGGAHPTAWVIQSYIKPFEPPVDFDLFDYAVVGEGEKAMADLVENRILIPNGDIKSKIIFGKKTFNLDEFPLAARNLLIMNKYNMKQLGRRTATMVSSRGCGGSCVYCSTAKVDREFASHSVKRIGDEVQELFDKYGFEAIYFHDDTYTWNYQRPFEIAKEMKRRGINMHARVNSRVDTTDYKQLMAMHEGGIDIVSFGIEHADDEILRKSGKGKATTAMAEQRVKECLEIGIRPAGYFILNLPGATEETARRTVQWAKDIGLWRADFYAVTAYPGTTLWNYADKMGLRLVDRDYGYWQAGRKVVSKMNIENPNIPMEKMVELLEWAKQEWKGHQKIEVKTEYQ